MKIFKKIIFIVLGLLTLFILMSPPSNDRYEPTISINEVESLSNTEIAEKLLTMYLEHYKAKPVLDDQRIEDYKIIGVEELYAVEGGTGFSVLYLIKQHFWNSHWGTGRVEDGMDKQFHFAILIKEKDQFRLEMLGTAPLEPLHPKK